MTRKAFEILAPPEWVKRYHDNRCPVCGKTELEFEPQMRVYCSPAHREQYRDLIKVWAIVRNKILTRDGEKCAECGITPEKNKERVYTEAEIKMKDFLSEHRNQVEAVRSKKLVELSEQYQKDYEALMSDAKIADSWEFVQRNEERRVIKLEDWKSLLLGVEDAVAVQLWADWFAPSFAKISEKALGYRPKDARVVDRWEVRW